MPATEKPQTNSDEVRDTPIRKQYLDIKARFPDTILFFRLGDFYETFDDDAELASKILDLVLTSREMGKGRRVPMAGIPYHAAEGYIARLIEAGHKVAVCEQVGEATKGKGLVDRDVTKVVTPGTVTEPSMLTASRNNFIAAVVMDESRAGIAFSDITTGEFQVTEVFDDSRTALESVVSRELARIGAAEVVVPPDESAEPNSWVPEGCHPSTLDPWKWRADRAADALRDHFDVAALDAFGITGKPFASRAAGALIQYLGETQMGSLAQITSLATYSVDGFMSLDAHTRRNLELTESTTGERRNSLVAVLDQSKTPMGGRLLRQWLNQPLLDRDELIRRQDGVEWCVREAGARSETRNLLNQIGDIERIVNRVLTAIANPRELASLRESLALIPDLGSIIEGSPGIESLPAVADVHELLAQALIEEPPALVGKGQSIRPGFASELDGHRARASEAREWIANLERAERDRTGIKSLKVGYNKVFGYYLEITSAALASAERDRTTTGDNSPVLPDEYIAKQSLTNATRYFTPQLKEFETLVLNAEDILNDLESEVYRRLLAEIAGASTRLLNLARIIAQIDVLSTFADVAVDRHYTRPELTDGQEIEIARGRHPTIEAALGSGEFVPNDAHLDADSSQIVILTGPNMAGKSSWLRQVALIVLMAQIGSWVPADRARIGLVDRIFTRIGAQDDIVTGQSTFMVEMLETAAILRHATPRSLVILDEIGRGTSTWDGLAIARAIVEYVHNAPGLGCKTLFATHYHELTELADVLPRVRTYRMDVMEEGDRVIFLRQVVPGGADRSYGIHVAELAGIPKAVVRRASEVLSELESSASHSHDKVARRNAISSPAPAVTTEVQLTMFGTPDPVVEELRTLDIESLSPLEAITKLFEMQRQIKAKDE